MITKEAKELSELAAVADGVIEAIQKRWPDMKIEGTREGPHFLFELDFGKDHSTLIAFYSEHVDILKYSLSSYMPGLNAQELDSVFEVSSFMHYTVPAAFRIIGSRRFYFADPTSFSINRILDVLTEWLRPVKPPVTTK